jgi:hypothetical protein
MKQPSLKTKNGKKYPFDEESFLVGLTHGQILISIIVMLNMRIATDACYSN